MCLTLLADVALVQKLQEELKYENEAEREETPEFLKQIQEDGIWTVSSLYLFLIGRN